MEKKNFMAIIDSMEKFYKCVDNLYNISKIDIIETPLFKEFYNVISIFIEDIYGKDGKEWFDWFYFEKMPSNNELKAFDKDKIEICKNIDELYEMLEKDYAKKS